MHEVVRSRATTESLGQRLDHFNGVGPGFDHLRIGLSLLILFWHSFSNSYGMAYELPGSPELLGSLLPMFFGLSGFLVMGSAQRVGNVKTFLTFRVLRILPALFTEITVSALILGPILTTSALKNYFTDPIFFEYFGSLIGRVRFSLPGLFLDNPTPNFVNFALWTVAPEILCYVTMTALMVTGIYRNRSALAAATMVFALICLTFSIALPPKGIDGTFSPNMLVLTFLTGNMFFVYRDRIPYSQVGAALAFIAGTLAAHLGMRMQNPMFAYLAMVAYVYTVAAIGLTALPKIPLLSTGDYSYGVYIFGFPIQQTVALLLPAHREWWINFAISLPVTLLIAVLSWHYVEKPFLRLRSAVKNSSPEIPHKALWLCVLASYALFLIYSNDIFPLRQLAKVILGRA